MTNGYGATFEETPAGNAATASAPVDFIPNDAPTPPAGGIGICLSGGGYRAMLFHAGALWRLNEFGILRAADRISSVSGGSIIAAVLGMNWSRLSWQNNIAQNFEHEVIEPIYAMAGRTIDYKASLGGILFRGSIGDKLIDYYKEHLYGDKTLQDLPDAPRFVINATNVQSGALMRFSKPYIRDWKVGKISKSKLSLAAAVAASSAFPPVLSPVVLDFDERDWDPAIANLLGKSELRDEVYLTDGGVYDNLGLETIWKRCQTVLVSDGGGLMGADDDPDSNWGGHTRRVLDLIDNQVRSLRKRQLIYSFRLGEADARNPVGRKGAYWGIRTNIGEYGLADSLDCGTHEQCLKLAATSTRLKHLPREHREKLINWGYAVCDAAMRRYGGSQNQPPAKFPF